MDMEDFNRSPAVLILLLGLREVLYAVMLI
jgi:hypothetical protein